MAIPYRRFALLPLLLLTGTAPVAAQDFSAPAAVAAPVADPFTGYLDQVRSRAVAQGVSPGTVAREFAGLTVNQRVIDLDRRQPGNPQSTSFSPFAPYRAEHVDTARIGRGRTVYQSQRARLASIERTSGVPESIMVAIWGHETNYGSYTGNFDLIRSLASLAYDGRRRTLFEGELIAALKMIDRGVPRSQLKGSWAGATGNPQFLPSIYLRLARDGDGDGRADIWGSEADTLASIAAYFVDAGWRQGQPWGVAVGVPGSFDRATLRNRLVSPRCPRVFERHSGWKSIAEWRAAGITPQGRAWPADDVQAVLIEPDGPGATAYLLTGNYRVILDYNCSNFYALSVGLLADAVEG